MYKANIIKQWTQIIGRIYNVFVSWQVEFTGTLLKMIAELEIPVEYTLPIGAHQFNISNYIDRWITLKFSGDIFCVNCKIKTNKSFFQGYCYPCFLSVPMASECVLRPELCRAHEGVARDMDWAEEHCLSKQYVYLSVTSGLKVGVTRSSQIPTRWIDQGASQAIKLAETPNRYIAGLIEVEMKQYLSDKTAWQWMLKNITDREINLLEEKEKLEEKFPTELKPYYSNDNDITEIEFPVTEYPEKVKSINLEKTPVVSGELTGIKGQYLYFDNERVLNIRKYQGYSIQLSV